REERGGRNGRRGGRDDRLGRKLARRLVRDEPDPCGREDLRGRGFGRLGDRGNRGRFRAVSKNALRQGERPGERMPAGRDLEGRGQDRAEESGAPDGLLGERMAADEAALDEPGAAQEKGAMDEIGREPIEGCEDRDGRGGRDHGRVSSPSRAAIRPRSSPSSRALIGCSDKRWLTRAETSPWNSCEVSVATIDRCTSPSLTC